MFDPSDFLDLSIELGRNNEARIRTAVGRAYYASFLTARNAFDIWEKTPEVHRLVLSMLYRKNPVIANKLHYLILARRGHIGMPGYKETQEKNDRRIGCSCLSFAQEQIFVLALNKYSSIPEA